MHGACHFERQDLPEKRLQKPENRPIHEGLMRGVMEEAKPAARLNCLSSWEDNLRAKMRRPLTDSGAHQDAR
jgi:hypothetical protein